MGAGVDRELLLAVMALAGRAGEAILAIYADSARWQVQSKSDDSPLTAADLAAHAVIADGLARLPLTAPLLSEESAPAELAGRREWPRFWLVDPLDGTKEFLARNGEFSVNIALVTGEVAVLGVVYCPVTGVSYVAARGLGAFRVEQGVWHAIRVAALPVAGERLLQLTVSRRHGSDELPRFERAVTAAIGPVQSVPAGSAFKICAVAEGRADAYPRFGPTSEWDTAAAQVVLEEAGGFLVAPDGRPFRYNARATLLNGSFLAVGAEPARWLACWPDAAGM